MQAKERFLSFFAGRRCSKTYSIRTKILINSLTSPKPQHIYYISPSYSLGFDMFRSLAYNPDLRSVISATRVTPHPEITWSTGSVTGFRSFDRPDLVRGNGLDMVCCDEIQEYDEEDFFAVIRPLVSANFGTIVIAGQHRTMESWYYKAFVKPALDGRKNYRYWQVSAVDVPWYRTEKGREELDAAKQSMPRRLFEQEYLALPISSQSALFDPRDIQACVNRKFNRSAIALGALDLGKVQDNSNLIIFDPIANAVLLSKLWPLGTKHEVVAHESAQICRKYNCSTCTVDSTMGATGGKVEIDSYLKFYRETFAQQDCKVRLKELVVNYPLKKRMVENLCFEIEKHKISIPAENEDLIRQLTEFEYKYKSGYIQYSSPTGKHDDAVASLTYAIHATLNRWYSNPSSGNTAPLFW